VGCMAELSPMEVQGFHQCGALGKNRCSPFDSSCEGFVPGEASACIVLESESSATNRGAVPLGEIKSVATLLAGSRQPAPDVKAEAAVMQKALGEANLSADNIDYINTHGTSSESGDHAEVSAINEVFSINDVYPWVNATKSIVGHNLWSASIVEAIAIILQINNDFLHPNKYLKQPINNNIKWVPQEVLTQSVSIALNNSFGFGGINTCSIFQKYNVESP